MVAAVDSIEDCPIAVVSVIIGQSISARKMTGGAGVRRVWEGGEQVSKEVIKYIVYTSTCR